MTERLDAVEEKIVYLERHLETLDELVQELFVERDRLRAELRLVKQRLESREASEDGSADE